MVVAMVSGGWRFAGKCFIGSFCLFRLFDFVVMVLTFPLKAFCYAEICLLLLVLALAFFELVLM